MAGKVVLHSDWSIQNTLKFSLVESLDSEMCVNHDAGSSGTEMLRVD